MVSLPLVPAFCTNAILHHLDRASQIPPAMDSIIYPVKVPVRQRDPKKPMQILALGLPRSGTDSLRSALVVLGYGNIWHGFEAAMNRSLESKRWTELQERKLRDPAAPVVFDFDTLVGDCQVLMDIGPVVFGKELLDYYPDAKVILNRRKDLDAWHRSLDKAFDESVNTWLVWFLSWFDAEFYWFVKDKVTSLKVMGRGTSFHRNGKGWAQEHYASLEHKLKSEGRGYLDWTVQDGWEPLCKFLDKQVPAQEFPWDNRGEEFKAKADAAIGTMVKRAIVKAALTVASGAALAAFAYSRSGYALP